MGYSECSSSVDSSAISITSEECRSNLNLKATELRLGLPGSQSPERDSEFGVPSFSNFEEKSLFPMQRRRDSNNSTFSRESIVLGSKREFSDAMSGFSKVDFSSDSDVNVAPLPRAATLTSKNQEAASAVVREKPLESSQASGKHMKAPSHRSGPPPKAQVVGWPPIRSFRKNSLAMTSKNADEVEKKAGLSKLFVKVSMDGAPYLRKVDLKAYVTYQELSSALEKMFSCFTIGQCTSNVTGGKEILCETKLKDMVHGSEYVLTYEDKDGDWMLVGDVPWEMFIDSCKRLRIMKSSDAIGLAPRALDKCRKRSQLWLIG